jgi:hypothetical protein
MELYMDLGRLAHNRATNLTLAYSDIAIIKA